MKRQVCFIPPGRRTRPVLGIVALLTASLLWIGSNTRSARFLQAARAGLSSPNVGSNRPSELAPFDLIIVPDDEGYLLAVAAPLAAKMKTSAGPPYLLALGALPTEGATTLTQRLNPRRSMVLTSGAQSDLGAALGNSNIDVLALDADPMHCGVMVARRFWRKCDTVIVASTDDPGGMILGSMFAAHLVVPFIPAERNLDRDELWSVLWGLGAKEVLIASRRRELLPRWARNLPPRASLLDEKALLSRLFSRLSIADVRNVILARTPDRLLEVGGASWMAPYLSLARGAPVVLSDTDDGLAAQGKVDGFIADYGVKPRSVTIIGNHDDIGEILVTDEKVLGEYEVSIEPCSGWGWADASAFAVGRFPFDGVEKTSMLVARGLARDRLVEAQQPRVLLIANPKTDYSPLPFCETVCRATAGEFKNCGIKINAFYGGASNADSVLKTLDRASLILYEGHITDQHLFEDPDYSFEEEDGYSDGYDDYYGNSQDPIPDEPQPEPDPDLGDPPGRDEIVNGVLFVHDPESDPTQVTVEPIEWEDEAPEEPWQSPPRSPRPLNRFPVVVVQSCHSLEEGLAEVVFQDGGAGLIGSVNNIHSASGSAFIKAFCDGLLYRGDTVGEALRDARNYFLCVGELKTRRGHKRQAIVYRVGLSFRLWGDPEMRVLPAGQTDSSSRMSARFEGLDSVMVSTPEKRLPTSKTEKYLMRVYPGTEVAGLVKRQEDSDARRLLPIYFFRLPFPKDFERYKYASLRRQGDKTPRGVFLTDPLQRYVYMLYYPWKERRSAEFLLQFEPISGLINPAP